MALSSPIEEFEDRPVEELQEHPENPRAHPDSAIDKLTESMAEYGFTNPVIATQDGTILAGHARVEAAQEANMDEVPVLTVDMDEDEAKAFMLADNRTQEASTWADQQLNEILIEIGGEPEMISRKTGMDTEEIISRVGDEIDFEQYTEEDDQDRTQSSEPETVECPHCGEETTL